MLQRVFLWLETVLFEEGKSPESMWDIAVLALMVIRLPQSHAMQCKHQPFPRNTLSSFPLHFSMLQNSNKFHAFEIFN